AMEQGYGLNDLISDAPLSIETSTGTWEPQNFSRQFHGDVSINTALAKSYNVATARLANNMGMHLLVNTLQQLGIDGYIQPNPSLSLGAIDLSPFQVAQMYNTIAADGFYSPLKAIRDITLRDGTPLNRYKLQLERRVSAAPIHQTQFALQSVMHKGTGKSVKRFFRENTVLAGKTGTSSDQRDSWFAGFNNKHLTVVWLGTDDNRKLPVTGGSGALPIWADIMSKDVSALGNKRRPNSLDYLWIDEETGLLSKENCTGAVLMPILKGKEPKPLQTCTIVSHSIKDWFFKWFQ
ncbi:MAG: penicillin-binding protein 1B, partial [Sinobacterium sp.]|nr:penicillin-binding protein 1B [Sinobacterium sp.]